MARYLSILVLLFLSFPVLGQNPTDSLETRLLKMYERDQEIRFSLDKISNEWAGKPEMNHKIDSVVNIMHGIDAENQAFVANLLDSLNGWPSDISERAHMAVFIVIQHSPTHFMTKYTPFVKDAYGKGHIDSSMYAIFVDRSLVRSEKMQIYGSQIINGYVWPIEDVENVDTRRNEMKLPPMSDYLQMFKDQGMAVVWQKDMTVDEAKDKMYIRR